MASLKATLTPGRTNRPSARRSSLPGFYPIDERADSGIDGIRSAKWLYFASLSETAK